MSALAHSYMRASAPEIHDYMRAIAPKGSLFSFLVLLIRFLESIGGKQWLSVDHYPADEA
jgi:hypothetical protein